MLLQRHRRPADDPSYWDAKAKHFRPRETHPYAQAFLEQHADVHAVLLSADFKTAFVSDGLQDKVRITDPSITVKIIKH